MIVFFDRKKILMCLIGVFCFIAIASVSKVENDSILVSGTSVSSKVIILDAGHGLPDGGAQGISGVTEEEINLRIVLKLQKLLEESGATVILTRSDENGIYDLDKKTLREKKISDLNNRVKLGNDSSADIFISIHLNKGNNNGYSGWQTFFRKNDENSRSLAKNIQKSMGEAIDMANHRIEHEISGIYLVDNVTIPITIVECGFLSNKDEEENLVSDEYQSKIAWGIYIGISNYFSN